MTVLVVDDEPVIRQLVHRALADEGAAVIEAENGEVALDLIQRDPGSVQLVITDLSMPGLGGLAVAGVLSVFRPDLPVLAMTGHSPLLELDRRLPLLAKPFTLPDLLEAVTATRTRVRRAVRQSEEQRATAHRLRAAAEAAESHGAALRSRAVDLIAMAWVLQASQGN